MVIKKFDSSPVSVGNQSYTSAELSSLSLSLPDRAELTQQAEMAIVYGLGLVAFGLVTLALLKRI